MYASSINTEILMESEQQFVRAHRYIHKPAPNHISIRRIVRMCKHAVNIHVSSDSLQRTKLNNRGCVRRGQHIFV